MQDILRLNYQTDLSVGLLELLRELNVQRTRSEKAYHGLDRLARQSGHVDASRQTDQLIGAGREREYTDFTLAQAASILGFLRLVQRSAAASFGHEDWQGAYAYWSRRAAPKGPNENGKAG
jgi:hypothetical protein